MRCYGQGNEYLRVDRGVYVAICRDCGHIETIARVRPWPIEEWAR